MKGDRYGLIKLSVNKVVVELNYVLLLLLDASFISKILAIVFLFSDDARTRKENGMLNNNARLKQVCY